MIKLQIAKHDQSFAWSYQHILFQCVLYKIANSKVGATAWNNQIPRLLWLDETMKLLPRKRIIKCINKIYYLSLKQTSFYSPYYAEAGNEFVVHNSTSERQGNTATFVDVEAVANSL